MSEVIPSCVMMFISVPWFMIRAFETCHRACQPRCVDQSRNSSMFCLCVLTLFESRFLNMKIKEQSGMRCQSIRRSSFFSSSGVKSSRACVRSPSKLSTPRLEPLSPVADSSTLASLVSNPPSAVDAVMREAVMFGKEEARLLRTRCECTIKVLKGPQAPLSDVFFYILWTPDSDTMARYANGQRVRCQPGPKYSIPGTDHEITSEILLDKGSRTTGLVLSQTAPFMYPSPGRSVRSDNCAGSAMRGYNHEYQQRSTQRGPPPLPDIPWPP